MWQLRTYPWVSGWPRLPPHPWVSGCPHLLFTPGSQGGLTCPSPLGLRVASVLPQMVPGGAPNPQVSIRRLCSQLAGSRPNTQPRLPYFGAFFPQPLCPDHRVPMVPLEVVPRADLAEDVIHGNQRFISLARSSCRGKPPKRPAYQGTQEHGRASQGGLTWGGLLSEQGPDKGWGPCITPPMTFFLVSFDSQHCFSAAAVASSEDS